MRISRFYLAIIIGNAFTLAEPSLSSVSVLIWPDFCSVLLFTILEASVIEYEYAVLSVDCWQLRPGNSTSQK